MEEMESKATELEAMTDPAIIPDPNLVDVVGGLDAAGRNCPSCGGSSFAYLSTGKIKCNLCQWTGRTSMLR